MDTVNIYEYTSAANPILPNIPIFFYSINDHHSEPTSIIPFDNKDQLSTEYPATTPSLLASFVKILKNEDIETNTNSTSQLFYVIKGSGYSMIQHKIVYWSEGDLFVVPSADDSNITHTALNDSYLFWVNDEPLLQYLGVVPTISKFTYTFFKKNIVMEKLQEIREQNAHLNLNRLGILFGNKDTDTNTKTITHTLWSLFNVLPANSMQNPHRHNSVAIDLCVFANNDNDNENSQVYTLVGNELDEHNNIINPTKCYWKTGTVFITPPGLWHSHHNETNEDAYVLPVQDAGLYTYLRTLNIQFA